MEELSEMIVHGISTEVALVVIGSKYGETISVPTLCYRINIGKMKCKNIHLRNKLKREVKEENLNYEGIEKSVIDRQKKRIWLYYANPYASYEKGQIENQNRLIRYFFQKGTDFSKYSDAAIIEKMNRINNYLRYI